MSYVTNTVQNRGNQAYTTNIITEKNTAYKPVTTGETVDVYEYI